MSLSLLLAVLLLTTPDLPAQELPGVPLPALQSAAVALEILDPRECKYVLTRAEDYAADMKLLRTRYEELRDAPPLCDAGRFPDRAYCFSMMKHCDAFAAWLNKRREVFPSEEWTEEALGECAFLRKTWDMVDDAVCPIYHVDVRRRALAKLRVRLGHQAYYAGCLPPAVPVWRFGRMD